MWVPARGQTHTEAGWVGRLGCGAGTAEDRQKRKRTRRKRKKRYTSCDEWCAVSYVLLVVILYIVHGDTIRFSSS
jgi:hypothetical protein